MIRHQGSDQRYEFPLDWDANGIAETSWNIPVDAKLGHYTVTLLAEGNGKESKRTAVGGYEEGDEAYFRAEGWQSGTFRVEEFRVPLMKGIVQPPKEPLVNAREMSLDLFVSYLSGGGAGDLPVKLRTMTQPRGVIFENYEGYTFANGEVKEGIVRGDQRRSYYDDYLEEEEGAVSRTRRGVRRKTEGKGEERRPGARPRGQPQDDCPGPPENSDTPRCCCGDGVPGPERRSKDRERPHSPLAFKGTRGYQAGLLARIQRRVQVLYCAC